MSLLCQKSNSSPKSNMTCWIKAVMMVLAVRYITELVGENSSTTYLRIYITMRVAINPIVDSRINYILAQLHRKGSINSTTAELLCCTRSLLVFCIVLDSFVEFCNCNGFFAGATHTERIHNNKPLV